MRCSCLFGNLGLLTGLVACLGLPGISRGQDAKTTQASAPAESIKSITDEYQQQVLALDRQLLQRLGGLASRQKPADAVATYEQLFRLAIGENLYREAETAAKAVVAGGSPSPTVTGLAYLVKIIAEADRGAFDQSIESLRQAVSERARVAQAGSPTELPVDAVLGIFEAYYQRLVQAGEFENARKALQITLGQAQRPVLKDFLARRMKRLDLVGKPAPGIQGTDLDGKPFNLADTKGKVVLVEFWASWSLPSADEVAAIQEIAESYKDKGLVVVGIDLDTAQDGGQKLETVLPNIRRFLLDHNVTWPTLVNGQGDKDYAKAYGVTEIPANVLIGRDGTIMHIDLVRKNLDAVVSKAIGK